MYEIRKIEKEKEKIGGGGYSEKPRAGRAGQSKGGAEIAWQPRHQPASIDRKITC